MSRYSVSERIFIVRTYYSNNNSPIVTQRKFATEFKLKTTGPSVTTINRSIQKFERTGSVCDDMFGNVGRSLSVETPEKIESVPEHRSEKLHNKWESNGKVSDRSSCLICSCSNSSEIESAISGTTFGICEHYRRDD
ncbi:hypothetical protein AVEN_62458-1 [Araneus ventricosus]|uniref:DUF4817 domain-containing protein n=1 Tax=Araneus ventricosus TaxID=182803 RepID=A0A4Y2RPX1_ARAVE|nr:hypothetical protein AVEN_62458-1 [Araneus ventricosus]